MEKKQKQKWIDQGKKKFKHIVFYKNNVIDVSQFMYGHPGGVKAIRNYIYKDVTNILFQVYSHPKESTLSRLMKFKIGQIPTNEAVKSRKKSQKNIQMQKVLANKRKKVSFDKEQQNQYIRQRQRSNQEKLKQIQRLTKSSSSKNKKCSAKSMSKSKKKQCITSIKIIDYNQNIVNKNKCQIKTKKQDQNKQQGPKSGKDTKDENNYSYINNELDEEKPNFKVPILTAKIMNKFYE